jgi:6-phosphogluconolactonase
VSAYTGIDSLAHQPTGRNAPFGLYVYSLNLSTGGLTLQSINQGVENPAFSRYHPSLNKFYTATESIHENGLVYTYDVCPKTMRLTETGQQDAGGKSTCFLTIEKKEKNMLFVNYWDSTLGTIPMSESGDLIDAVKLIDTKFDKSDAVSKNKPAPKAGAQRKHSLNDPETASERQASAHAHSIVLDPAQGKIAFVPDLGQDCIHQYLFNDVTGTLDHRGKIPADSTMDGPHGPRYIEFHKSENVAYVINEMSCSINVLEFHPDVISEIEAGAETHCLTQIQQIATVPEGYPSMFNTCGRICIDPTGNYVLVSNRGHDSIAIFRINKGKKGKLTRVGWTHTSGNTPRHFAFDESGKFLIAANQDSDNISVFDFNPANGQLTDLSKSYVVPSPNFVCIKTPFQ